MPTDWRSAFRMQAKSDYAMLLQLNKQGAPLCHQLHYLQMTTEKLAKSFLTPPGSTTYKRTHKAFEEFVKVVKGRSDFRKACGFEGRSDNFKAYINSLLSLAGNIESLSPEGEDHPNPEYPWMAGGIIYSPTEYPFTNLRFDNPKMVKMLEFIADCFRIA